MAKRTKPVVDRRDFLKGAAAGAAALAAVPASIAAEPAEHKRVVPPPMSAEAEVEVPSVASVLTADRTGFSHAFEWPLACAPIPAAILEAKFAATFGPEEAARAEEEDDEDV